MRDSISRVPYDSVDDLDPANLARIDSTMRHGDHQDPRQQAALMEERKRLEQTQAQWMQKEVEKEFQQRLYQRMNPYIGTEKDTDPAFQQQMQAEFMAKLMAQMQNRVGRPQMPQGMNMPINPRRMMQPGGYPGEGALKSGSSFFGVRG